MKGALCFLILSLCVASSLQAMDAAPSFKSSQAAKIKWCKAPLSISNAKKYKKAFVNFHRRSIKLKLGE